MITKRSFLIGLSSTLVAAPTIVKASSLMQIRGLPLSKILMFEADMRGVVEEYNRRKLALDESGMIHPFEQLVENKMKEWGTYQPLKQMSLWDPATGESRLLNMYTNPNFRDSTFSFGRIDDIDLTGFWTGFKDPLGRDVSIRYTHSDKAFKIEVS